MKVLILLALVAAACSQSCVDKSGATNCLSWKKHYHQYCKQAGGKIYCEKTCGFCGGTGTGTGTGGQKCGVSPVKQSRIINGVAATPGAWPWIASFQRYGKHFCGATLLTPKWLVTASHCVEKVTSSNLHTYKIKLGAHDHSRSRSEASVQTLRIKRVIMHPSYHRITFLADLAMVELETPAKLDTRVGVPCLPQKGVYPALGKICYLAGWGSMRHLGGVVKVLQQTALPVVSGTKCKHQREVVCVGNGFNNDKWGRQQPNACRGDSGGPLVCQKSDGSWQLEGVAGYVYTYCKYYTGYSPVNKYLDWIKKYTNQ